MHSLEDGALVTNVTGRCETQTANQTSAHVGQNVSIQVGHNKDLIRVRARVCCDLQAGIVEELGIELDVWEVLAHITGGAEEEAVGHFHDSGLVYDAHLLPVDVLGVLEGITEYTLGSSASDKLDGLDDTVDDHVLDTRVFSFCVFSNDNRINIVVGSLVTFNRSAWPDIGKEVEGSTEG